MTPERKAGRKIRTDAMSDLYLQMPQSKRRQLADLFNDLLIETLTNAKANTKISDRDRADILKGCTLAYKQLGEVMENALEAEARVRALNIEQLGGIPAAVDIPASLMDFIPKVSPNYEAPHHLQAYVEAIESTLTRERRIVISCPPQHGKSEATIHALVWYLMNKPQSRNAYISYQSERAEQMSLRTQWIADEAKLVHQGTRRNWRTARGGSLIATGIGGGITGYGFDGLVIVDDPFKGMAEANSPTIREHVKDWFRSVLMTRVHAGASVIVIQTRWNEDDLAGQLIAEGWENINLPAINEAGVPLWPTKWPADLLVRRRVEVGEFVWSALYMGAPRAKGTRVFNTPSYYSVLPEGPRRDWIGIDMAYTKNTYADYSVALVASEINGKFYIVDMVRVQEQPPQFRDRVNNLKFTYPNATLCVGCATSEQGSAYFLQDLGLELNIQKASVDKFLRSQPVAAAWNAGNVLLPENAWWLEDFKKEFTSFTGVSDRHDDIIDAMGSAYNAAKFGSVDWSTIEQLQREIPKAISW